MAPTPLKRAEAVVWLPPRASGERALGSEPSLLVMHVQHGEIVTRRASLETLPAMRSVRLVLDARDVTLLRANLPALSEPRLQRALPNLLEDQLLQEGSACAWAMAPRGAGERLVAVVDREWLDTVVQAFERRGVRVGAAWPAQALRWSREPRAPTLLCLGTTVALRPSTGEGLGLACGVDATARLETLDAAFSMLALPPQSPVTVFAGDASWQDPLEEGARRHGLTLALHALPVPTGADVDLMNARVSGALARRLAALDIRAWRAPLTLTAAALALAVLGLNLDWLRLRQEQTALRNRLDAAFEHVFPATTARIDPVLQLTRHVGALRARSGQPSPEDFLPLSVALAQALATQPSAALGALEYRDGRLRARLLPGVADTRAAREALEQAARQQGLRLRFDNEREPLATVTVLR